MDDCLGVIGSCLTCGNPVLGYLCNAPLSKCACTGGEESQKYDYWSSCSNVLCENHGGSGYFDYPQRWVSRY